ncbi:hypothetical protein EYF80_051285 [Liparis tanakae]|uniref:Uncharacterized protein n=1 Tax=Liparis tanakae TaxID=230148 RepID=A0A4Z2FCP9_9TELE|nr:hypothetical protein EYF80_051285 [Liparis tanakae]
MQYLWIRSCRRCSARPPAQRARRRGVRPRRRGSGGRPADIKARPPRPHARRREHLLHALKVQSGIEASEADDIGFLLRSQLPYRGRTGVFFFTARAFGRRRKTKEAAPKLNF